MAQLCTEVVAAASSGSSGGGSGNSGNTPAGLFIKRAKKMEQEAKQR